MTPAIHPQLAISPTDLQAGFPPSAPSLSLPGLGNRLLVRWDPDAKVTPWDGLAHFTAFLAASGLFERLVADAPFAYTSPNAPEVRDVVGTMVLGILLGYTRYLHLERLRNDLVLPGLLGLSKIVSESSVRRALQRCPPGVLDAWISRHSREILESLLQYAWILDIDNTVKPLYGHQEGAELGYNPAKPGRPSHNYHSYFIALVRLCIGVDVHPGSKHAARHGLPGLWKFIDSLPARCHPCLLRGDVSYGSEETMAAAEARHIRYLFKLRRSSGVKALFKRHEGAGGWRDVGRGWEGLETAIRLEGWTRTRRGILLRRPAKEPPAKPQHRRGRPPKHKPVPAPEQLEFDLLKGTKSRWWDTQILVTDSTEPDIAALAQLYRDRGDCENNFDEYKNQWGWCGFVTRDLQPTRAMAGLIALVANWWNIYVRLADGDVHREAVTTRPALMGVVARLAEGGRRTTAHLTSTHAASNAIRAILDKIASFTEWLSATARQLPFEEKWAFILRVAYRKWLASRPLPPVSDGSQRLIPLTG